MIKVFNKSEGTEHQFCKQYLSIQQTLDKRSIKHPQRNRFREEMFF